MQIKVSVDNVTPALNRVRDGLNMENLLPMFAEVVAQEMQANFMSLDASRPNYLGGERTNYFAQAAQTVDWRQEGDNKVVVFSDHVGINMKYFGGTIAVKRANWLTIPVSAESYGKRASDFPDAKVLFGRNGPYGLGRITKGSVATMGEAYGEATTESHEVLFIFKKEVEIQPDEAILPTRTRLNASLRIAFNDYMDLLWENAGGRN